MWTKSLLMAALLIGLTVPAFAQAPQQQRIRGTITKFDGKTLTIKSREGAPLTIALAPNYTVRTLVRKKLTDIHQGDFVGTTSVPGKDGKLHAVEIHFFPASLNIPDSQSPWDLQPGSMMTNAHVTGVAKSAQGQTLSVNYKNGTADVIVDRKTAIVAPGTPGSANDLKPGKAVYIMAIKAADGSLTSGNITVEKNGVKPPM
jgi:hypothetical protein